ncbi:MAG: hypothetical protein NC043_07775 [Muribaculaceae bacterium]|nr:hypothetical protein [Muribaculaceae bacterium]
MNYRDYSYQRMRDADFMRVMQQEIALTDGRLTQAQAAERAVTHPAPSYYVGMPYALRVLRHIRRTGVMPWHGTGHGRRWVEIVRRVDAIRLRHGVSDPEALARVLAEGHASSFFIEPGTALRLYHRLRRRHSHTDR